MSFFSSTPRARAVSARSGWPYEATVEDPRGMLRGNCAIVAKDLRDAYEDNQKLRRELEELKSLRVVMAKGQCETRDNDLEVRNCFPHF